ncbi:MAG: ATP-binding cassette domain-containing protein [Betaproteobacteria bacterium]|nr:MAG: ATP-binding cassette domain-containing protein [Betaproteobacteria bacterium]
MIGPLLKVSDLKKSYGAIQAVAGVSFEVMPGEVFGVIGPNGSGKTTMFNSVLGQIKPNSGRIELNGRDITGLSPLELNRRGVGRTFQTLQVFGKMSVRDNLIVAAQEHQGTMARRMFAPPDSGLGAKADELIDLFRIRHVADTPAGSLSYGQQKLVDIAMAFMSEPDLVLLDEPCAGVNPSLVGGISSLLKKLNQTRRGSFVVIEHNMDFVMDLCHRIMVMVEGTVMAIGTPAEFDDVVAGYKDFMILNNLSFQAKRGAITLLLGPNGAGKSTVLKTLFGILKVRQGRIRLDGEDITGADSRSLLAKGVAFVPQGRNLFGQLSVWQNLELGGITLGMKTAHERIPEVLERFPRVKERLHSQASALSGGEQKQLEIGRALLLRPKVLLIDEPSIGLSPLIVLDVFKLLRRLADQGTTVLMVEQNVKSALKYADEAIALESGRQVLHKRADELLSDPHLERLFLGGAAPVAA